MRVFNFGRKSDPGAKLSPDQEIERIEGEIFRLRSEAAEAKREAGALAISDPERSVELDARALAAERLIARLQEGLPALYAERREQACAGRDAEIDRALAAEQEALRQLAKRIQDMAMTAARAIKELRGIGVEEVMGRAPIGLHGPRLVKLLCEEDAPPEAINFRVDADLEFQIAELEQAAELLKRAERQGRDLFVKSARNASLIPLAHQIERHLQPFVPPPEAPEPDAEPQPAEEA